MLVSGKALMGAWSSGRWPVATSRPASFGVAGRPAGATARLLTPRTDDWARRAGNHPCGDESGSSSGWIGATRWWAGRS